MIYQFVQQIFESVDRLADNNLGWLIQQNQKLGKTQMFAGVMNNPQKNEKSTQKTLTSIITNNLWQPFKMFHSSLNCLWKQSAKLMAKVVTDVESVAGMTSSRRRDALVQDSASTRKNRDDNQYMTRLLMTHTHIQISTLTESGPVHWNPPPPSPFNMHT